MIACQPLALFVLLAKVPTYEEAVLCSQIHPARFSPSPRIPGSQADADYLHRLELADAGAGSLRAAITSANGDHTGDTIDFSVAGVIKLTSGALPTITDPGTVNINGATAPGFADTPVVEIDNNGFAGITVFGSMESLSIVNAKGPGVTLYGTVAGNYIGLASMDRWPPTRASACSSPAVP